MQKRILSTFLLWGLVITTLLLIGPSAGVWLLTILAVLSQYELYKLLEKMGCQPQLRLGLICGALIVLGSHYIPRWSHYAHTGSGLDLFFIACIVLCARFTQLPLQSDSLKRIFFPTLFGLTWIPLMLQCYVALSEHFAALGQPVEGLLCAVWLIAVAKFTDVGGLLAGKAFGKHKLSPTISPNKTWEGALGGVLIATVVGIVFLIVAHDYFPDNFTLIMAITIAIPVACVSILSDLIESLIKRQAGMKDSGSMIPGIGGAFDLSDSLLLSAPVGLILFKHLLF